MDAHKILTLVIIFGALLITVVIGAGYALIQTPHTPTSFIAVSQPVTPTPTEIDNNTLQGIDSDHNGVRDDVEKYIAGTYSQSQKTRMALMDFSKGMKLAVETKTEADAKSARETLSRAQDCLWYIHQSDSIPMWQGLRAVFLNTQIRSTAYANYGKLINVQVIESTPFNERKARCNFDPDVFPD